MRLQNIDCLRGLAALSVVYQHLSQRYSSATDPNLVAQALGTFGMHYFNFGKFGVVLFFLISGYIIPFSFATNSPRTAFIFSRLFRLYPSYWLSLVLAVLLFPILGVDEFSGRQILANITMIQTGLHEKDVLVVYWTLFVEIVFYATCFCMFSVGLLKASRSIFLFFCALICIALLGASLRYSEMSSTVPTTLPLYVATMWFGTCLRLSLIEADNVASRRYRLMLPILLVAVPAIWYMAYGGDVEDWWIGNVTAYYLAIALFIFVVRRPHFSWSPFVYLGSISYALYLFHPLAVEVASSWAKHLSSSYANMVLIFVSLLLSWASAHLVFVFVEKPSIRLGKTVTSMVSSYISQYRQASQH